MIWISITSILFFLYCAFLVIRLLHYEKVIIIALLVKIIAGIALGLIYKYHYQGGDTFVYFDQAATIANYIVEHPGKVFALFFSSETIPELDQQMVFAEQPRALLFSKIISIFYLGTGGNYWIIGAWLSLLNFLGLCFLVFELTKKYPFAEKLILTAFFYLPTFVFWTSGLLKESLAIGALGVAVGIALRMVRTSGYSRIWHWFFLVASIWLLWKLKYFYAAALMPLLATLLILEVSRSFPKYRIVFGIGAILLATVLVTNLHYNLHFSRILDIVYNNYLLGKTCADCASISYFDFDGSPNSYLINLPLALFSGLFRPLLFEVSGVWQLLVSLENTSIFLAIILAVWKSKGRIQIADPWMIGSFIFVITLATFIAFSTPNFGTLSRYKVAYWPFFVLLVFGLMYQAKKRPGTV